MSARARSSWQQIVSPTQVSHSPLTRVRIWPHVDYFVAERFAIGANVTATYTSLPGDFSTRTLGIGPSVTYFFGGATATVHPYVSARASIAWLKFEAPTTDQDGSARAAAAAVGMLTMLSTSVGLTTEMFYSIQRQEIGPTDDDTNVFGLSVGIAAFVF